MMYLAVREDRVLTIAEMAEAYNISKNHLMKIMHHLRQKGFIETVRDGEGTP